MTYWPASQNVRVPRGLQAHVPHGVGSPQLLWQCRNKSMRAARRFGVQARLRATQTQHAGTVCRRDQQAL